MVAVIELRRVRVRSLNMELRSFCGKALDIAMDSRMAAHIQSNKHLY